MIVKVSIASATRTKSQDRGKSFCGILVVIDAQILGKTHHLVVARRRDGFSTLFCDYVTSHQTFEIVVLETLCRASMIRVTYYLRDEILNIIFHFLIN